LKRISIPKMALNSIRLSPDRRSAVHFWGSDAWR
jgi:hypothetical protein